MSIIIDLVLLAIIAFCAWNGYRKGFILGISGILALVIAFYGSNIVANTYSQEFTSMIEPFMIGIVDSAVDDAKKSVSKEDVDDVSVVTTEALGNIGIIKSAADEIAESISAKVSETGKALREELVSVLCSKLAYIVTTVIVFLLIIIAFTVFSNILNLAFKLPGLEIINGLLGTLFGLAKGLIFAFAIAWVLTYFGFLFKDNAVNDTILLSWLMDHNLVARFFGL